jgi:hypothetical protein
VGESCSTYSDCKSSYCDAGTCAIAEDCAQLEAAGVTQDGIYQIDPDGSGGITPFDARCNMTLDDGGWTLVATLSNTDDQKWSDRRNMERWLDNTSLVSDPPPMTSDGKSKAYGLVQATEMAVESEAGAWGTYGNLSGKTLMNRIDDEKGACNQYNDSAATLPVQATNVSSMNRDLIIHPVDPNANKCVFRNTADPDDSSVFGWKGTDDGCQGSGLKGIGTAWQTNIKNDGGPVTCHDGNCWEDFTSNKQWDGCSGSDAETPLSNNQFGNPDVIRLWVR